MLRESHTRRKTGQAVKLSAAFDAVTLGIPLFMQGAQASSMCVLGCIVGIGFGRGNVNL